MVFANPEEELIVAESELCIDYEVTIHYISTNWPGSRCFKIPKLWLGIPHSCFKIPKLWLRIPHNLDISGWTLWGRWCCSWNRRGGDETLEEVIINQSVNQYSCSRPITNNFQNWLRSLLLREHLQWCSNVSIWSSFFQLYIYGRFVILITMW